MAVLCLMLAAAVLVTGLARLSVERRPAHAARLWGARGEASLRLAERAFLARQPGAAAAYSSAALRHSLARPETLRILAFIAEQRRDEAQANRLLSVAARWGWRDVFAQVALFRNAALAGDYETAFQHYDALARLQALPEQFPPLVSQLADSEPAAVRAFIPHLEAMPKWRRLFFQLPGQPGWSQSGFEKLLLALRRSNAPATAEELAPYLEWLRNHGQQAHAAALAGALLGLPVQGDDSTR